MGTKKRNCLAHADRLVEYVGYSTYNGSVLKVRHAKDMSRVNEVYKTHNHAIMYRLPHEMSYAEATRYLVQHRPEPQLGKQQKQDHYLTREQQNNIVTRI